MLPNKVHFRLVLSQVNECVITQHSASLVLTRSVKPSLCVTDPVLITTTCQNKNLYCYLLLLLLNNNFYAGDICAAIYASVLLTNQQAYKTAGYG